MRTIGNTATANACNAANESVAVSQAAPGVGTTASAAVTVGGTISDSALLSGGVNPTGTLTFSLYGPNNATCTGSPIFTSTVVVSGNGSYVSTPAFTTASAGTYRWIANYSRDATNVPTTNPCNAANESVIVTAPRTITPVPTLSDAAMLLLTIVLGILALPALSRRT
jgi:hypothetical protein